MLAPPLRPIVIYILLSPLFVCVSRAAAASVCGTCGPGLDVSAVLAVLLSSPSPVLLRTSGAPCPSAHACACLSFFLRSASRTRCSTACTHTSLHCCQLACFAIARPFPVAVAGCCGSRVLLALDVLGAACCAVRACCCLLCFATTTAGARRPLRASAASCLLKTDSCTSVRLGSGLRLLPPVVCALLPLTAEWPGSA